MLYDLKIRNAYDEQCIASEHAYVFVDIEIIINIFDLELNMKYLNVEESTSRWPFLTSFRMFHFSQISYRSDNYLGNYT